MQRSSRATSGASGRASEKLEVMSLQHTGQSRGCKKRNSVLAAQELFGAGDIPARDFPPISAPPSPRLRPPPDVSARRAGKRWAPIDVSGIECSALRLCRRNDVDFPVDRRAVVSAALPDPQLCRRSRQPGPRRNHGALGSKPKAGLGQRSANWPVASRVSSLSLGRPGATGHGNQSRREGSGSDSASPARPGGRGAVGSRCGLYPEFVSLSAGPQTLLPPGTSLVRPSSSFSGADAERY